MYGRGLTLDSLTTLFGEDVWHEENTGVLRVGPLRVSRREILLASDSRERTNALLCGIKQKLDEHRKMYAPMPREYHPHDYGPGDVYTPPPAPITAREKVFGSLEGLMGDMPSIKPMEGPA
jgi:hypothetical protein